jgi:hypothetical protein
VDLDQLASQIDPFRLPEMPYGEGRGEGHPLQEAYSLRIKLHCYAPPAYWGLVNGWMAEGHRTEGAFLRARTNLLFTAGTRTQREWFGAYIATYLHLATGNLGAEIVFQLDLPETEVLSDMAALPKVFTKQRERLFEAMWRVMGVMPPQHSVDPDGEVQHQARYSALYDFLFSPQFDLP